MAGYGHGHGHQHKHGHGRYAGQFIDSALANYSQSDLLRLTLRDAKLLGFKVKGVTQDNFEGRQQEVVAEGANPEELLETLQETLFIEVQEQLPESFYSEHKQVILGLIASAEGLLDSDDIEKDLTTSNATGPCEGVMFLNDTLSSISQRVGCSVDALRNIHEIVITQLKPMGLLCQDAFQYSRMIADRYFSDISPDQSGNEHDTRHAYLMSVRVNAERELNSQAADVFACLRSLATEQERRRDLHQGVRTFRGGVSTPKQVAKLFKIDEPVAEAALKLLLAIFNPHVKVSGCKGRPATACVHLRWNEDAGRYQHLLTDEDESLTELLSNKDFTKFRTLVSAYIKSCSGWKKSKHIQDNPDILNQKLDSIHSEMEDCIKKYMDADETCLCQDEDAYDKEMNSLEVRLLKEKKVIDSEVNQLVGAGKGSINVDPREYLNGTHEVICWLMLKRLDEYDRRKDYYARIALYLANQQAEYLRGHGKGVKKVLTARMVAEQMKLGERKTQRWTSSMVIDVGDSRILRAKELLPRSKKDIWKSCIREILKYGKPEELLQEYCSSPERGLTPTAVWKILLHCYGAREHLPGGTYKDTIAQKTVYNYCCEIRAEG